MKKILSVLKYFSIFNYPLTLLEIKRWILKNSTGFSFSFEECVEMLKNLEDKGAVKKENGLYFINQDSINQDPNRLLNKKLPSASLTDERNRKYRISEMKRNSFRRYARLFACFPFVGAIASVNRVGTGCAEEKSDLDFAIFVKDGWLYFARFLIAGFSAAAGWRVSEKNPEGLCLSFYCCAAHTDFGSLRFKEDDVHFAFWVAQFLPVYDSGNIFAKVAQNNAWLKDFFSFDIKANFEISRAIRLNVFWRAAKCVFEGAFLPFQTVLERAAYFFENKVLKKKMEANVNFLPRGSVVWNEHVIKLHWNDSREKYYLLWKEALKTPEAQTK